MKIVIILLSIIAVLYLMSRTEKFQYTDETKPVHQVILNDPTLNMNEYKEVTNIAVNHDIIEDLVLATNKYIREKTGLNNYIIETTAIKQFKHKTKNHDLYQCMFMTVKPGGFTFGFSVTADIMVVSGNVRVIGVRSQPIDIKPPSNTTPFESEIQGQEFVTYDDIKKSELDLIKIYSK